MLVIIRGLEYLWGTTLSEISNNLIEGNTAYGIYIYGESEENIFEQNEIIDNHLVGLLIDQDSPNNQVSNNLFSSTSGTNIIDYNGENSIEQNVNQGGTAGGDSSWWQIPSTTPPPDPNFWDWLFDRTEDQNDDPSNPNAIPDIGSWDVGTWLRIGGFLGGFVLIIGAVIGGTYASKKIAAKLRTLRIIEKIKSDFEILSGQVSENEFEQTRDRLYLLKKTAVRYHQTSLVKEIDDLLEICNYNVQVLSELETLESYIQSNQINEAFQGLLAINQQSSRSPHNEFVIPAIKSLIAERLRKVADMMPSTLKKG